MVLCKHEVMDPGSEAGVTGMCHPGLDPGSRYSRVLCQHQSMDLGSGAGVTGMSRTGLHESAQRGRWLQ